MQNSGNIEFPNCKPYSVLQSSVVFYSHHPKSTTFRALFRNILSPKVGCWFSVGTGEVYPTTKNSTCLFSQGWPERLQFHLSPREKTLPGMGKGNILKISSMSMSGTRQTWVNPSLAEMMCNGRQWKKPLAHSRGAGWNPSPSQESLGPGTSNHVKQNTFNQVGIFCIKKHLWMPMDAICCLKTTHFLVSPCPMKPTKLLTLPLEDPYLSDMVVYVRFRLWGDFHKLFPKVS